MDNSYKFFTNESCQYFPCHASPDKSEFNCLFCFCPLYLDVHCGGKPKFIKTKSGLLKDCSHCTLPHEAKNYEYILQKLTEVRFNSKGDQDASC